MNKTQTLRSILEDLYQKQQFSSLKIMYRIYEPGGSDMLFGYCTAYYTENGLELVSDDGDIYELTDKITKYTTTARYFNGLVVWFKASWVAK